MRQLLTHTAGRAGVAAPLTHDQQRLVRGNRSRSDSELPTLAEYYQGGLRLAAEPGTIWTYTDHGFATLGQIVEDVSGQPLDRYLREHVFEPLGMTDTDLLRSRRLAAAAGHRLPAAFRRRKGGHRPSRGNGGGRLDLLHAPGHGALSRRRSSAVAPVSMVRS